MGDGAQERSWGRQRWRPEEMGDGGRKWHRSNIGGGQRPRIEEWEKVTTLRTTSNHLE
jgi:hypothetical protein